VDISEGDQGKATMNTGHVVKPSDGKKDSGKDNSDCASKKLDYGCEDLLIFG
jgi:hypothetical protein